MKRKRVRKNKKRRDVVQNISDELGFPLPILKPSSTHLEVVWFILQQEYFKAFDQEEKKSYILGVVNGFDFSHAAIKMHYRDLFKENFFLDESIINYKSSKLSKTEHFFITSCFPLAVISALIIYFWAPIQAAVSSLFISETYSLTATFLFLLGSTLAAFDMYFKQDKLNEFDGQLYSYIKSYESSWINSIKVSMLINHRKTFDLLDIIKVPLSVTIMFLYATRQFDIDDINKDHQDTLLYIFLYFISLRGVHHLYMSEPDLRKLAYYVYIFLSSPYILTKSILRAIPLALFLPAHTLLRLALWLKPTSAIRVIGFLLMIFSYFVDKYIT